MTNIVSFGKELVDRVGKDDCAGLASEMAYHFLLASAPAIVFIFSLISIVGDPQTLSTQFMQYAQGMLPPDALSIISGLIEKALNGGSGGLAIASFLGALWASSNGAATVIKALRRAYNISENDADMDQISFVRQRLYSILIVLSLGLTLFIASNLLIWGKGLTILAMDTLNLDFASAVLLNLVRWAVAFLLVAGFTTFIYKIVPGHPTSSLNWRQSLTGGSFFVVSWVVVSYGFSIYVENFGSYNEVYGSLGAIVVTMLWLYLSSFLFLIGGEINAVLDKRNLLE